MMIFTPKIIEFIENNFDIKLIENKKFLKAFKDIVTSELDLKYYLREIIFSDLSKYKAVATYYKENQLIIIDFNAVREELELMNIDINQRTIVFQFYEALLHEIKHAAQDYRIEKAILGTFEICLAHSNIVKSGNINLDFKCDSRKFDKIKAEKLFSEQSYLFPSEREAETFSWKTMLSIYTNLFKDNFRENRQLREMYSEILFEDYDINNCPLEKFYNLIDRQDIFNTLDFSQYNVHERCLYGMPLTSEEYTEELNKSLTL